jgi:hypothetical protein
MFGLGAQVAKPCLICVGSSVKEWSDEEVARRWWKLFPQKKDKTGKALEPTDSDLGMMRSVVDWATCTLRELW